MLQTGNYKFLATFPGIYKSRPITHYHVMVSPVIASCCPHLHPPLQVSTPGSRGKTLITQIYFRDYVPGGYEVELETNLREVSQGLESKNNCQNFTSFYWV